MSRRPNHSWAAARAGRRLTPAARGPYATLSRTVRWGKSRWSWKTSATRRSSAGIARDPSASSLDPDRIDPDDEQAVAAWAKRLDATPQEVREAVRAVGGQAADVEMHLKGSRSTTNSDRVRELGG